MVVVSSTAIDSGNDMFDRAWFSWGTIPGEVRILSLRKWIVLVEARARRLSAAGQAH